MQVRQKLTTRDGRKVTRYVPRYDALQQALVLRLGFCIACGSFAADKDPDALAEDCPRCHRGAVYGPDELLARRLYHRAAPNSAPMGARAHSARASTATKWLDEYREGGGMVPR